MLDRFEDMGPNYLLEQVRRIGIHERMCRPLPGRSRDLYRADRRGLCTGNHMLAAGHDIFPDRSMNFLGHLLVSGEAPLVIVGNFMADAVKGRDLSSWSAGLRKGIRMHRRIDSFTDNHPLTLQGRERLRAHAGKYAGVALDLFYDHALAVSWHRLSEEPLADFAQRMYGLLERHAHLMPARTQYMLPHMVRNDWLTSYATIPGLARALNGLAARVPGGEALSGAEQVLLAHYSAFVEECLLF